MLPIRAFILAAVHARFPTLKAGDLLILKDQNASLSAPLVTEATRASRLLVLVRDPRDVMAFVADALRVAGSWARSQFPEHVTGLDFDIETWSADYAAAMAAAFAAHDAHGGPKAIVTYEALCAHTPAMLRRVCDDLRIAADDGQIAAAVRKNDWAAIPAEQKGSGRFHRKATPGAGRGDLTAAEVNVVERHTACVLRRFYPSGETGFPYIDRRLRLEPQYGLTVLTAQEWAFG